MQDEHSFFLGIFFKQSEISWYAFFTVKEEVFSSVNITGRVAGTV